MKLAIVLSLCGALLPWPGAVRAQKPPDTPAASEPGKSIFVSRCAKCHDQDANKKLPDGTTLLARLAKSKDPEARLATRLKNEQERHQVMLYIQSIMVRLHPAQADREAAK